MKDIFQPFRCRTQLLTFCRTWDPRSPRDPCPPSGTLVRLPEPSSAAMLWEYGTVFLDKAGIRDRSPLQVSKDPKVGTSSNPLNIESFF